MYDVPPRRWVKVSRMHFQGAAARWIESLEHLSMRYGRQSTEGYAHGSRLSVEVRKTMN
jgi:hypothetical protein